MSNRKLYESANDGNNRLIEETLSDGSKVYNVEVWNYDRDVVVLACSSYAEAMDLHLAIKKNAIIN